MRKVYLEGVLGEKYGAEWNLAVNSPAEALTAIMAQRPGMRKFLIDGENVLGYEVLIGKESIQVPEELIINDPGMSHSYSFVPVIAGSKSTALMMVMGVALVAMTGGFGAAFVPGFMSSSVAGAGLVGTQVATGAIGTMHTAATAAAVMGSTTTAVLATSGLSYLGMGLLLGGVAMMLAPDTPDGDSAESAENYLFSGPVNTVKQGEPIPLVYGRAIVGSKTVMGSLFTTNSRSKIPKNRKLVGIGGFREDGAKHGDTGPAGRYVSYGSYGYGSGQGRGNNNINISRYRR